MKQKKTNKNPPFKTKFSLVNKPQLQQKRAK